MKIRDVRVSDAQRKKANGDNPGLVLATFESHEQVSKVLKAKTELRKTNDYNTVYIEPYLSQSELSTQATFRTFLREIGKSDNYHVHGSKLIPRRRNSTARGYRQGEGRRRSRDRSHGRSNDTSAERLTHSGRSHSNDCSLVVKATGVTIEGRTRTMGLIKDIVIHLEITIAVNTVGVPIDI